MSTYLSTLVLPILVLLSPGAGEVRPGPIEVRTPVEAVIAPQGRFQLDSPYCSQVRPGIRPNPAPTPAWRRRFEPESLAATGDRPEKHSLPFPCARSAWASLSGSPLVEAIATSTGSCLELLWTYDADTAQVVAPANVEAVADEIILESSSPVTNAAQLERLCLFLQIAFYHEFYEAGTDYGPATEQAARDAMVILGHRPELLTSRSGMLTLRKQWAVSMDSTNSTLACLGPLEAILARFEADPALVLVYEESLAIYYCLSSIARQIYNDNLDHGANSPWVGAVPTSLAGAVRSLAVDLDPTPEREPLKNSAIWTLGHFSYLDLPTADSGRAGTSDAFRIQPTYSGPWLWSIRTLETFYGARLDDGTVLDVEAIHTQVRAFALPNLTEFDQGKVVFETALPDDDVERLYAATKEVTAQFFRKCTFLQPVPGDVHGAVTVAVFASPEDYARFQPFLFGTSTNNGGIYLEDLATLCTFDRTPSQSIYSLEELVRHEYTHYLDGRFNVTGDFYGSGSLYQGGRIDSYVEGLAEFVAGSTRIRGVLPRRKLLQLVESDSGRMSVAEIVAATYSQGFRFYSYAGLLFAYLEEERPERFLSIFQAIRGNDPAAVDALEASLAGDFALQQAFDAWMEEQLTLSHDGQTLFAEDVPTVLTPPGLPLGNEDAVLADLTAALPGGAFQTWNGRYRYEGTLTLPTTGLTPGEQRVLFDERTDLVLAALEAHGQNFVSAIGWCGDTVYGGASATAAFAIEGPLGEGSGSSPPGSHGGGGCAGTLGEGSGGSGDPSLPLLLVLVLAIAVARSSRVAGRSALAGS